MDAILHDITVACRVARADRAATAVVIATLALAIGAAATVFSIVDAWLLRPLDFPEADRLVIAVAARRERPAEPAVFLPFRSYAAWKERSRSLAAVSAAFRRTYLIGGRADASTVVGLAVSDEFFETLGVSAALGRTLERGDAAAPPAAVLSHGLWERQFGASRDVIGMPVTLNGIPHQVVGVMPRELDVRMLDQDRGFELWTLFDAGEPEYAHDGVGPVAIIGRLAPGVTAAAAQSELTRIHRDVESKYPASWKDFLVLLTRLQDDNTRTIRATLLTVTGAVMCVLLIACVNVGAVQLGRGLHRAREVAVRAALGSDPWRLIRQFLVESLLLSGIGGVAGVMLSYFGVRGFLGWNPIGTVPPRPIGIDLRVCAFALAATLLATVICGLFPALRAARVDPAEALRGGGRATSGRRAQRPQLMLLAAQIAISIVLLVATSLLVRTFVRLQSEPLGIDPRNLTIAGVSLPTNEFDSSAKRIAFYRRLADRLTVLPGVHGVAAGTMPPLYSGPPVSVWREGNEAAAAVRVSAQEITPEFFGVLGVALVAGRAFAETDAADRPGVAILNESAARTIFGSSERVAGRRLRVGSELREVVGIVGNTRGVFFNTLEWVTNPIVYLPAAQAFAAPRDPTVRSFGFHVHVRSARPIGIAEIREAVASLGGGVAVGEVSSGHDALAKATRQPAFRMALVAWFGAASLLLAAIGVYGVVSQGVVQRRREIGVRLALGAYTKDILRVVAGRTMAAAIGGALLGLIAALALGSLMRALLYGVRAADAISFVSAAAALLAVTGIAAVVPALRATRVDPAEVLRAE